MNRIQLEHIIRAASSISADPDIVVIGSQAIHALERHLPPIAFISAEADIYPRNHPERADDVDAAIGELSAFHGTFGYYAHGVSPLTAILPAGWEQRLIAISGPGTGGATGFCLDPHDLVLSKYAAAREKDLAFNTAIIREGCVTKRKLVDLVAAMPLGDEARKAMLARIKQDFAAAVPGRRKREPHSRI